MKPIRITFALITLAAVAPTTACDNDCADLHRGAITLTLTDIDDPSQIRVTVTTTDGTVLSDAALEQLQELQAGSYDLSFRIDSPGHTVVSNIDGVCTVGPLTGCEVRDRPSSATPTIDLSLNENALIGSLASNGTCP